MQIIYMMYEGENAPISISRDINVVSNRFMDLTKAEILKSCWLSIQGGLDKSDTIHLLAAKVSDTTKAWLADTCKANLIIKDFPAIDDYTPPYGKHPYAEFCELRVNHFIPQYVYFMEQVEQSPDDLYYLCNDDYLHLPDAIANIKKLFKDGFSGFFVPHDYPDNYTESTQHADLYLTNFGYMRTISSATPTLVAKGNIWLHFKYPLLRASVFADDSWTWRAFNMIKALTPMPGWSTHLQNNCIAPYIDWYSVAKQYLEKDS